MFGFEKVGRAVDLVLDQADDMATVIRTGTGIVLDQLQNAALLNLKDIKADQADVQPAELIAFRQEMRKMYS